MLINEEESDSKGKQKQKQNYLLRYHHYISYHYIFHLKLTHIQTQIYSLFLTHKVYQHFPDINFQIKVAKFN